MGFFLEVLLGGLMAGVLYSLVALGLRADLQGVGRVQFRAGRDGAVRGALARAADGEDAAAAGVLVATCVIMLMLAYAIERLVLRPLVNQPGISLFMATLGITFFLEGFGQILWGSDIYKLDLGIPKQPVIILENVFKGGILVGSDDLFATVVSGALVIVLAIFFQKTRIGRALRAVADDHQAAQSIGIPLNQIWLIVWTVAGLVALVAGIIWGSRLGVQFSLSLIALKALPVVILGGFTSVPGRDRRRAHHRRRRENVGGLSRPAHRRRHRELVCVHGGARVSAGAAGGIVRGENH